MDLMVAGHPNKVIAMALRLSVRTIESRRRKVFDKTQMHSVAEIVRLVAVATDRAGRLANGPDHHYGHPQ